MTTRHTADTITDPDLDALYRRVAELERLLSDRQQRIAVLASEQRRIHEAVVQAAHTARTAPRQQPSSTSAERILRAAATQLRQQPPTEITHPLARVLDAQADTIDADPDAVLGPVAVAAVAAAHAVLTTTSRR